MQENVARADRSRAIPFDAAKLDRLMEAAGLDVLVATSKHNVQYLLGGQRAIFFDYMDAMGVSRYLPVLVYPKGAPEKAVYFGHRLETHQRAVAPPWVAQVQTESNGSVDAMTRPGLIRDAGVPPKRVGVETGVPADGCGQGAERRPARRRAQGRAAGAGAAAGGQVGGRAGEAADGVRARHRLDAGGDRAGTARARPSSNMSDALRLAEANRGLTFEYCLLACGNSHNRAPSAQRWEQGDVLSLDSGGNYHGYIGDLARMAVLGEPDAELRTCSAEIEAVQRAAFAAVRPARMGGDIYAAAERQLAQIKQRDCTDFLAHGMGLVSHEAPRLTAKGPSPTTTTMPGCRSRPAWWSRSRPR